MVGARAARRGVPFRAGEFLSPSRGVLMANSLIGFKAGCAAALAASLLAVSPATVCAQFGPPTLRPGFMPPVGPRPLVNTNQSQLQPLIIVGTSGISSQNNNSNNGNA